MCGPQVKASPQRGSVCLWLGAGTFLGLFVFTVSLAGSHPAKSLIEPLLWTSVVSAAPVRGAACPEQSEELRGGMAAATGASAAKPICAVSLASVLPDFGEVSVSHGWGEIRFRSVLEILCVAGMLCALWGYRRERTRRVAAEETLGASAVRHSMTLEVCDSGVWEWNTETDELRFDAWFHAMLGYTTGELPKTMQEWLRYLHPDDLPVMISLAEQYTKGAGTVNEFEHRIRRKSGEWVWVFTRGKRVSSDAGNPGLVTGITMDVTSRRRSAEALDEARRVFQALVENSPDPIARYDRDRRRTYVNPTYLEVTQIPETELISTDHTERTPLPPAGAASVHELLGAVLSTGVAEAVDIDWPRVTGVGRWYNVSVYPEFDGEGRVQGVVTVSRDITERTRTEEALRRLNRELRAIGDCNQALLRAADEQSLLQEVCRIVCDEAGYRMAWVGYAEHDEARTIRPVAWAGVERGYLELAQITWHDTEHGRGAAGTAVRTGKTCCIQDFELDPLAAPWRESAQERGFRSNIALPIKDERELTFGVFTLYSTEPNAFTPDEVRLLEGLARDLAFGVSVLRSRVKQAQAERELQESEKRLRLTLEAAQIGIWDWDIKKNRWIASPTYYTMLGYEPKEGMADRGEWLERVHPDDRAELDAKTQEAFSSGFKEYTFEVRLRHADGTYRWQHVKGIGIDRDPDGTVSRVLGIRLDVTERKRSEETIRQLNADLSATLQAIPDLLFEMDRAGTYLGVWAKNAEFLVRHRERLLGHTVAEVLSPEVAVICMEILREADEKGSSYGKTIRVVFPEGPRWFELSVSKKPNTSGHGPHFIVLSRDITARRTAEDALRETEQKYRLLVSNASEAIFIVQDEVAKFPNAKALELTGYSAEELAEIPFASLIHSEDRLTVVTRHLRYSGFDGPSSSHRFRLIAKSGRLIWTQQTMASVVWEERPGILCFLRDITEEMQLESQFLQAQKMEAVGQLAGGVAHDFNNLLQVILGYVDVLQGTWGTDSADGEALTAVRHAAERAADLTRQLLAFSRRQVIQPINLDIHALVEGVLKMVRRVIGENIDLHYVYGEGLGRVYADKGQLEQVLMNLCVNSRDAMPLGGRLTIETDNAELDEAYCRDHPWAVAGRYVSLSVADTGHGMDEATQAQVFEPFFTTKDVGRGTGLGLATVYGIVKQHRGLIRVESALGRGAQFKVYLPLAERRVDVAEPLTDSVSAGGAETILVAEDEESVRELVSLILESAGYTVLAACDGEAALQVFEKHGDAIDLALLDVIMPKLGGREVMDRIRATHPGTRFLFSSGYTQNALGENSVLEERVNLIMKPYRREDLLRMVREVLDRG